MRRSIVKLDSSKHLLDEVGASDASNGGKSVSWVHSSAYERSHVVCKKEIFSPAPVNNMLFSDWSLEGFPIEGAGSIKYTTPYFDRIILVKRLNRVIERLLT